MKDFFSNRPEIPLKITAGSMDVFNYALSENYVSPIRGITALNSSEDPMSGLFMRISSDFPFFKPYEQALPEIPAGKPISLANPNLIIEGTALSGMTESTNATITVEIFKGGETVCGFRGQMKVLAYDQWQGFGYINYLPAFVMPNHPVIPMLLHEASERLKKWGRPSAIDGYQSHDPNRVRDLAAAAYAAIQKKNITYATAPANLWEAGQRIRTPEVILDQHLGNCMDMTLLYASCLEAMGLHVILYLIKEHIFAGVWLTDKSFEDVCLENRDEILLHMANGSEELSLIECTAMCSGNGVSFEDAEYRLEDENLSEEQFECAIDVFRARVVGVRPLPSRSKEAGAFTIEVPDLEERDITAAPDEKEIVIPETVISTPHKITNKRELWESKLLDLSGRNILLNLPRNASVVPIMSSHIDELEDALSDGHEFRLQPAPEWIFDIARVEKDENGCEKAIPWLETALKEMGVFELKDWPVLPEIDFNEKFRQEYRNHRMYTFRTEKQLDRDLTKLYRAARASQQENGVSSLYLAIGLLRWFPDSAEKSPCYAPLILLPVEIIRKSANQGYALHARADDPHFNTTLLEMLRQNFELQINGLEPLPSDEHGIDIRQTFAIVRKALLPLRNWDVAETCVIGNFSFAQFAMWNDIHTAADMLENSEIVRSLMKGHIDWQVSDQGDQDDQKTYLPITVDATQLKAIKMAAQGNTFVLHGPPGTGKSQTITGMIANLMAQGKRVLFVAEKMAALSVVQRRLTQLGIGDFCLELHSNKANKKQVLTQLSRVLSIGNSDVKTDYGEYLKKTEESRAKLDEYASHLHSQQACGYSLRELIALYETVRDREKQILFRTDEAGCITEEEMKRHLPLIDELIATGEAVGGIAGSPLIGVGITSYGAELRGQVRQVAERYQAALTEVEEKGDAVSKLLGEEKPENKRDFAAIGELLRIFFEVKSMDSLLLSLPEYDPAEAYAYYDQKETVLADKERLLQDWHEDFLRKGMSEYRERWEAAGKKFFGKAGAKRGITMEIQAYAKRSLTYEVIPRFLDLVEEYQKKDDLAEHSREKLSDTARSLLDRFSTKEECRKAFEKAKAIRSEAERFPGGMDAVIKLAADEENSKLFETFGESLRQLAREEKRFNELLEREDRDAREHWLEEEQKLCDFLTNHPAALKDWGLYNRIRQECVKAGLQPVVTAYEGGMKPEELQGAYKKGIYYALINHVILSDDILSSFSGASFNQSIELFKKLDDRLLEETKKAIFLLLAFHIPESWDSPEVGRELSLLRKAIGSSARGMSIRELFERIPHILPGLAPCMLMSPNSVAQYLAQKNDLFDVVIFDEASQLPTCKAAGALCRAKNAVIVGDPKQMPPTTFFAGSGPEVNDLELDDLDSILDDALALGIPSQYLQWHYRSTHESLIAFSNHEFYENKMYTFPSANDRERHVTAVHVDGTYSRGTNIKEAEAVIQEVVRRYLDPELSRQSIGIVTFNVKQQTLIEDLLAKQFQTNPSLDVWANSGEDPLFVKNLENVQGDERDVILFSIGYGPDEKGHVSNNFGPINKQGGGKRLNVAFSRSRITMTIFASLRSEDIRLTASSPEGLVAFHDFLKFAEGQDIQTPGRADAKERLEKDGILQNICEAVRGHGLKCEAMVGHSDFHVDIAVVDPYETDRYMMGIVLDGEEYRRTKNTRDREVAQIDVLKHLGWSIYRVWAMDWWDNRDRELSRLLTTLDALREEARKSFEQKKAEEQAREAKRKEREAEARRLKAELEAQAAELAAENEENEPAIPKTRIPETKIQKMGEKPAETAQSPLDAAQPHGEAEERNSGMKPQADHFSEPTPYVSAKINVEPLSAATFPLESNRELIVDVINQIIEAEAPIFKENLMKKVFSSFRVGRTSPAVETFEKALRAAKAQSSLQQGFEVCWREDQDPKAYTGIRVGNARSGEEICPQEIANAICYVLRREGALDKAALVKETSRVFGYKRLGSNLEYALLEGLKYAEEQKVILTVDDGNDSAPKYELFHHFLDSQL